MREQRATPLLRQTHGRELVSEPRLVLRHRHVDDAVARELDGRGHVGRAHLPRAQRLQHAQQAERALRAALHLVDKWRTTSRVAWACSIRCTLLLNDWFLVGRVSDASTCQIEHGCSERSKMHRSSEQTDVSQVSLNMADRIAKEIFMRSPS